MRVLLAGASGAVGRALIPLLLGEGHEVGALVRSERNRESLREAGTTPYVADALDPAAVESVVGTFQPDAIIHQLTAIPQSIDLAHFDREFVQTNLLRTKGTDNLVAAAKKWSVRRFVAQGFAGSPYERIGNSVKTESDPFDADPPEQFRNTFSALRYLERAVMENFPEDGIVLRYGWFYGPRTSIARDGPIVQAAHKRALPIVADGTGLWSFCHVEDAAGAALAALRGKAGIYNIADDEPALVRDWITFLAELVHAPRPLPVPAWMARMVIGDHGVAMMRDNRGISNARAKQELGWSPRHPNWREGFRREMETQ